MSNERIKRRVDELMARGIAAGQAKEVTELSQRMGRLLRGREPQVQGATLADLLATFLAGHHPLLRELTLELHLDAVQNLIPLCEMEIFGPGGWPEQDPEPPPP